MKINIILIALVCLISANAQSLKGKLSVNGESQVKLKLETNSAVQLFKEFKIGKHHLKFNFETDGIPTKSLQRNHSIISI